MTPSIGRIVHYVSHGTPGGEYTSECRAAIVTAVGPTLPSEQEAIGLAVLNPTGMFFLEHVRHDEGGEKPGDPNCIQPDAHGNPFRYCSCGWMERSRRAGTWHWPEQV
jgi:hypothetical protein